MMKRAITINNIPAIIWGDDSDRVIIAIHGNQSNKAIRTYCFVKEPPIIKWSVPTYI